jgi:hypothetical protein
MHFNVIEMISVQAFAQNLHFVVCVIVACVTTPHKQVLSYIALEVHASSNFKVSVYQFGKGADYIAEMKGTSLLHLFRV